MKLEFPKIVRDVPLSEYAPELTQVVKVWVNPPVKKMEAWSDGFRQYAESQGQEGEDAFLTILSELLSQGEELTRWSVDELKQIRAQTADTDPRFFWWFQDRIAREIYEHRAGVKKA